MTVSPNMTSSVGLPNRHPDDDGGLALPDALLAACARTPARLFVGLPAPGYPSATQLRLRQDHAFALDSVRAEFDLFADFGVAFIDQWRLFEVSSQAKSKAEYLARPDLGRKLSDSAASLIADRCPAGADLQVVIGDGLSAAAVRAQVPTLLPLLQEQAVRNGWTFGQPFVARHARVGLMNDIGQLLGAKVLVLLIGERPGLTTAESLSAYMAFRPRSGHTDADRNLISNIHGQGVLPGEAAERISALASTMMLLEASGPAVKEDLRRAPIQAPTQAIAPTSAG